MKRIFTSFRKNTSWFTYLRIIRAALAASLIIAFLSFLSCEQTTVPQQTPRPHTKSRVSQDLVEVTTKYFSQVSQAERNDNLLLAKKINAFVHNYCSCESPLEMNIENLLKNCRTACGGYVYVFQQIAKFYGIQTRTVYLFNISLQGNHAMVEVKYGEDKWALFDPTFGTYFTPEGKPSEIPYSLDDLYFYCSPDTLIRHVLQARAIHPLDINSPIDALYLSRSFNAANMKLSTYLSADAYGNPAPYEYSLLWMDIDMRKSTYQFGGPAKTIEEGDARFLGITNRLLNDKIPNNRISYNISFLGQMGEHTYKNGYRLYNLKKGRIYRITLFGINPTGVTLYPHFTDSRAVLNHNGSQVIPDDIYVHTLLFRARDTDADLILEAIPQPRRFMRIFGIRIELDRTAKSSSDQPCKSSHERVGFDDNSNYLKSAIPAHASV
jgi:hypothetical protein